MSNLAVVSGCTPKKVVGRVLGEGSQKGSEKGLFFYGLYSKKGLLRRGSEKGVSRRAFPEGAQKDPSESTTPQACA